VRPRIVPLLASLVVACGGPGATGTVELGATLPDGTGFVQLGGEVELVPGAQGGFHVWVKFRAAGIEPQRVRLKRFARRSSDGRLILRTESVTEIGGANGGGRFEAPDPIPWFMCPSPVGVRVRDERVTFDLALESLNGTLLGSASGDAVVRCPAGEQAAFCERICSG
jgi:hypothetical protein